MKNPRFARTFCRVAASSLILAALPGFALAAPTNLSEEQTLLTPTGPGSNSGQSSAMSDDGKVAVIGAPGDSGTGKAYVFTRSGTIWTLKATLTASDGAAGDQFGASVSISGDATGANIAVGAPNHGSGAGAVYLFTGSDTTWPQNSNILTSGLTSAGALGKAVSIQGFRVLAGAPNATTGKGANAGIAIVFDSSDSGATFSRSPFRPNGGQARVGGHFGASVSLSGSTALVGAPNYRTGNKANSGIVFVFVNNGGNWTQQTSVRPANVANNFAGTAVALFSNSAAFGAPGNSNGKGAVYVYTRTGTTWSQTAAITGPGAAGDNFGSSVGQLGTFVVAGAPFANSNGGAAYEYAKVGNSYSLVNQLIATNNAAGDQFGTSLSVNASRVAVGAPTGSAGNGNGYVFKFLGASLTTITCFSSDPNTCVPQAQGLTGIAYTVFVHVADGEGSGTPSGTVDLDDTFGGTCTATLDGNGDGHCTLTSNHFGSLTMKANYNGDVNFAPSQGSEDYTLTGDHLVFNPAQPANVTQGEQASLTVEVHNGADALITTDGTTQVTLNVQDTCGDTDQIGPVTVVGGIATFTGVGPKFYTITSGNGDLGLTAVATFPLVDAASSTAPSSFDVVANPDMVFPDGFEDCRL